MIQIVGKTQFMGFTGRARNVNIGKCPCGQEVILGEFTNECPCGRMYNGAGQELAPRRQWGSETGEFYGEIERNYEYHQGI